MFLCYISKINCVSHDDIVLGYFWIRLC